MLTSDLVADRNTKFEAFFNKYAVVLLVCFSVASLLEFIVLGDYSLIRIHDSWDVASYTHPLTAKTFQKYGFTNWFPSANSGLDKVTDEIDGALFKFYFNHLFSPLTAAFFSMLSGTVLLILGTYFLARKFFGLSAFFAFISGLLAYMFVYFLGLLMYYGRIDTQFAVAIFPLTLLLLDYLSSAGFKLYTSLIIAVVAGLILGTAGSFYVALPFMGTASLFFFLIINQKRSGVFWVVFSVFWLSVVGVNVDKVILVSQLSDSSHRILLDAPSFAKKTAMLFSARSIVLFVLLLCACVYSAKNYSKNLSYKMLFRATVFSLLVGWVGIVIVNLLAFKVFDDNQLLGIVKHLSWARLWYYVYIIVAIAFALTLQNIRLSMQKILGTKTYLIILITCLLLVVGCKAIFLKNRLYHFTNYRNLTEAVDPKTREILNSESSLSPFRVGNIGVIPAHMAFHGFEAFATYSSSYSYRYKPLLEKIIEPMKITSPDTRELILASQCKTFLFPARDTWSAIELKGSHYNFNLLGLVNVKYIFTTHKLNDANLSLVRSYVFEKTRSNLSRLPVRFYLYENLACLPRAFSVQRTELIPAQNAVFDRLAVMSKRDFLDKAIIENDKVAPAQKYSPCDVEFKVYSPDYIRLEVNASKGKGFIVLSNSYSKYWKCYVDNVETPIQLTNGAFWGVEIEKDAKKVEFYYAPQGYINKIYKGIGHFLYPDTIRYVPEELR